MPPKVPKSKSCIVSPLFGQIFTPELKPVVREALLNYMLEAFGHCPNSFCTPPPHANGHSGALCLRKKCPKPSGQGSGPPQNQANSSQKSCPKPSGRLVIKGLLPVPNSMNFRKTSEWGGGHFRSEKLCCAFSVKGKHYGHRFPWQKRNTSLQHSFP